MSDEDDPKIMHSVHLRDHRLKHQELIQSVKERIKPGLTSVYFKAFDKQMIKDYLNSFKKHQNCPDVKDQQKADIEEENVTHTKVDAVIKRKKLEL